MRHMYRRIFFVANLILSGAASASAATPSKPVALRFGSGSAAGSPTISAFSASSATIAVGQSSTLTWTTSGAVSLNLSGASVTGSTSWVVTPTSTTVYVLTATNASGSAVASSSVTVVLWNVNPSPSFVAGGSGTYDLKTTLPALVKAGGSFTIDPSGAVLPAGMALSSNGIVSVGTATAGTFSGVVFSYNEP